MRHVPGTTTQKEKAGLTALYHLRPQVPTPWIFLQDLLFPSVQEKVVSGCEEVTVVSGVWKERYSPVSPSAHLLLVSLSGAVC